jgi:hypothetical protein
MSLLSEEMLGPVRRRSCISVGDIPCDLLLCSNTSGSLFNACALWQPLAEKCWVARAWDGDFDRLIKSFGKQRPHQAWTECQACAADKMIRATVWLEGYSRKFGPAKPSFQNGSSLLPCRCRLLEVCSETDCSVQKYSWPEGELINSMPFVNW